MAELPQDAVIVKQVLESMGVTEYEPRVLQQLMDFMYRYTSEILQDAEAIAERGGAARGEVSLPDVMLAVQSRAQHSFVQPPSQQMLARLAEQHNRRPLPELRQDRYGLRLPPESDCLLAPNYQLQPRTPDGFPAPAQGTQQRQQQQAQQPSATAAGGAGARREHRIEIRAPQSLPAAQLQQEAQQPEPRPEGGWVGEPAVAAPSLAAVVAVPPALSPAPAGLGPAPVVGQEAAAGSTPAAGQQQQHAQQQQPGPNDDLETMLFEDI